MSANELRTFESQLKLLSYAEKLAVMEFLVKLLKEHQKSDEENIVASEVDKINAVLEKIPEAEQTELCDAGLEAVRESLKNDSW